MDSEVIAAEHLHLRMPQADLLGGRLDPFDQDPGEQEERGHDQALEAEFCRRGQALREQRPGGARVTDKRSTKPQTLLENPSQLGNVGVRVGIRGAPADHD